MLGKPSRYRFTDPGEVMNMDGVPLSAKGKDDRSMVGFQFPENLREGTLPPKIKNPHAFYPINPMQLHNNTIPYVDPLEYMRIENKTRIKGYIEFYDPLHSSLANHWLVKNEHKVAWGKPYTDYLRATMLYFIGVETARRQGYVALRFWRYHYFDWIGFAKAGFLFGFLGGGLIGMFLWGDYRLAWRRTMAWFNRRQHIDPRSEH